eukprot:2950481-Amphidinium_carterae.2
MPQLAGEVSIMASRSNHSTVLDAITVNSMLSKHIKTAAPLVVRPIPLSGMGLLVFVDASLANVDSHRSQAGHLVCACEQKVLRGDVGKTSIITYTSHTLHRVVGSTLMAETCALTEALSEVACVCKWMAMAKDIQTVLKEDAKDLKIALATDAKSVYDNVRKHQESYTNHDKRVSLELAGAGCTIGGECRWVPHFENPADCLTKMKGNVDRLLQLMRDGTYGLVNETETIQERQQLRAQGETIPRPSRHASS